MFCSIEIIESIILNFSFVLKYVPPPEPIYEVNYSTFFPYVGYSCIGGGYRNEERQSTWSVRNHSFPEPVKREWWEGYSSEDK